MAFYLLHNYMDFIGLFNKQAQIIYIYLINQAVTIKKSIFLSFNHSFFYI